MKAAEGSVPTRQVPRHKMQVGQLRKRRNESRGTDVNFRAKESGIAKISILKTSLNSLGG